MKKKQNQQNQKFDVRSLIGTTEKRAMSMSLPKRGFTEEEKAEVRKSRVIKDISFSSETEDVSRYYGVEILGHAAGEVRMGRLDAGANLLFNHNVDDYAAVIENARIGKDLKLRGDARFGKSDFADRIMEDVLDGILPNTSLRYEIFMATQTQRGNEKEGTPDKFRIIDWEPVELSIVTVPADPSVGVGRQKDALDVLEDAPQQLKEEKRMPETIIETPAVTPVVQVDTRAAEKAAGDARAAEVNDMFAAGANASQIDPSFNDLARKFVADGNTLAKLHVAINAKLVEARTIIPVEPNAAILNIPEKDIKDFSFMRVYKAIMESASSGKPWRELAPHEAAISDAYYASDSSPKDRKGTAGVPYDILVGKRAMETSQRAANIATGSSAGYLYDTNIDFTNWIELFRNSMKVPGQVLSGLVGDVILPGQSGGMTAYMVGESEAATLSYMTTLQKKMTPKTLAVRTNASRLSLNQTSVSYENLLRTEMNLTAALKLDSEKLVGSGANGRILGLLNTSGIGSVAGGANGLAPTWDHCMKLKKELNVDNALFGSVSYLTNASVEYKFDTTPVISGQHPFIADKGMIGSYPVNYTNQVPSNLTKGSASLVCSAIIMANWNQSITGLWSGIELGAQQDIVNGGTGDWTLCLWQEVDYLLKNVTAFAAMQDALTT